MKKEVSTLKSKLLGFIREILKFVERYLVLTIVIVLFFAFGVYKIGSFVFYKKVGETSMKGYKRIDSLFTAFAYIPIYGL